MVNGALLVLVVSQFLFQLPANSAFMSTFQLRRSKRLLRRTSSLGEESEHDHYSTTTETATKRSRASDSLQFTIGVIADIQYAPIPDGYSYSGAPRYYRNALEAARFAANHFEADKVDLVVNLGDIVDGKCQNIEEHGGEPLPPGLDPGHKSVDDVIEALSVYKSGPVIHAYGNHCLYNLDRPTLATKLGIPFVKEPCGDLVGYSCFVHKSWAFITLDSYDVGTMQRCEVTSQKRKQAEAILKDNNPNFYENINSPEGLVGVQKRFVGFNGGVGALQLQWLKNTLDQVRSRNERAIILSHQPILPGSSSPVCLMWNYKEVLDILRQYSDVVVVSLSGHAHKGGYKRDRSGIHFRVIEAVLENPYPHNTYAMVDVYDDGLNVRGFGNCKSAFYGMEHQVLVSSKQSTA